MRHPFLLLFLPLLACQPPSPAGAVPDADVPDLIKMTAGKTSVAIDPRYGARIVSFAYEGREMLQTERDPAGLTFGSTAWPSPQSDWGWPPPVAMDSGPYSVRQLRDNAWIMEARRDSASLLTMSKRFILTEEGKLNVTYYLKNDSGMSKRVAAWENTRLPYGGRIEFVGDSVRVSKEVDALEWRDSTATITFDRRFQEPLKVFASLKDTLSRYYHPNGLVLNKQHMVTELWQTAPEQAPLEVYWDPVKRFVEYELQGTYYTLADGQSATLRTLWFVTED